MSRLDVRAKHLNVQLQKNFLMPDVRFVSQYGITGIGSQLDGSYPANAFASLAEDRFQNWQLGLQMYVPLGFRQAHANVRQARLSLAQSYELLYDQERKAKRSLELQWRRLFETYEQIKIQRAQREAAAIQLRARYQQFQAGLGPREGQRAATLDVLLEAQRVWADALRAEYENIVFYNNALAGFEFAKGTIQNYDNVAVSEGELPVCAQTRAVEHERRRSCALVLRHRAEPLEYEECCPKGPFIPKLPSCCEAVPLSKVSRIKDLFRNKPSLAELDGAVGREQPLGMDEQVEELMRNANEIRQTSDWEASEQDRPVHTELPPLPEGESADEDRGQVLPAANNIAEEARELPPVNWVPTKEQPEQQQPEAEAEPAPAVSEPALPVVVPARLQVNEGATESLPPLPLPAPAAEKPVPIAEEPPPIPKKAGNPADPWNNE
jgi:hypothetical protein